MKNWVLTFASAGALIVGASAANAQSMDYGSLQSLFGEPVTTAATGTPQRVRDVPVAMDIITADDIQRTGLTDIAMILSRVPGLDVAQSGAQGFDVGVRGYNQPSNPRLLVLINGRQVYQDHYAFTNWNSLPVNIDEIRQIEVVKGPNTALFGFNAVGGVVNIVTYSPLYDDTNTARLTVGTQNRIEGSATTTAKIGDMGGIRFSAGGLNMDEFDTPIQASDVEGRDNPGRRFVAADGMFQLNDKTQAGLEATYSKSDNSEAIAPNYLSHDEYEVRSLKGSIFHQTDIGLLRGTAYVNDIRFDLASSAFHGGFDNQTYVGQLELQSTLNATNKLRTSLEWRRNQMDNDNGQTQAQDPNVSYDVYSAGATWLWQIMDNLSWTNAGRVDYMSLKQNGTLWAAAPFDASDYDRDYSTISINSGLVYSPTDVDTFRLSYARGIQAPSLVEYGMGITAALPGPATLSYQGNPYIKPTVVNSYEFGYDRKVAPIMSTLKASVYFQTLDDVKSLPPTSSTVGPVFVPGIGAVVYQTIQNVGSSEGYGAEFEIDGQHKNWRWKGSYALAFANDFFNYEDAAVRYQAGTPEHQFRANIGYDWGNFTTDLYGKYVTDATVLHGAGTGVPAAQVHVDGYLTTSASIGYKLSDNYKVQLTGTQINADSIEQGAYPDVERQVLFSFKGQF